MQDIIIQTLKKKLLIIKSLISRKANHLPAYISVAEKLLNSKYPYQLFIISSI